MYVVSYGEYATSFILIAQHRMAARADKRTDLDLQISLLSEHEIARLMALVTAQRMRIHSAQDSELTELAEDVAPEKLLDAMEAQQQRFADKKSPSRGP